MIQTQSTCLCKQNKNNQQNEITDIYHIIPCIKTYWKSLPSLTALLTSLSPKQNIGVFMCKNISN